MKYSSRFTIRQGSRCMGMSRFQQAPDEITISAEDRACHAVKIKSCAKRWRPLLLLTGGHLLCMVSVPQLLCCAPALPGSIRRCEAEVFTG